MKYLPILGLVILSTPAFALEVSMPGETYPELEVIEKTSSYTTISRPQIDKKVNKVHETSVLYTYSQSGFEQTGSGKNYDTENATGQGVFVALNRNLKSSNELNAKIWMNHATFAEPTDIGGKEVTVKRLLISTSYGLIWKQERSSVQLDLGVTALTQNPDNFTNNEKLVPEYLAVGPSVGLGYKFQVNETWKLGTGLSLTLPQFFRESGSNSGYHKVSGHYIGNFLATARLNRALSLTFGVLAEGEQHTFDGSGERGVRNAKVTYLSFALPVGVSYVF